MPVVYKVRKTVFYHKILQEYVNKKLKDSFKKGFVQGYTESIAKIALKMREANAPLEIIQSCTFISEAELEKKAEQSAVANGY